MPLLLKGTVARRGQEIFLDDKLGKCNLCHQNAGANANFAGLVGNQNFDTGVEDMPDQPARLTKEGVPADDGFGNLGDRTFNTPPLVEAAETGPFFHNNSVATLEAAVGFYDGDSFNESPADVAIAEATGGPIELDATQIQAIASFLRVLNALDNIRQSIELLETTQKFGHAAEPGSALRQALAETGDAICVFSEARLHPEAVARRWHAALTQLRRHSPGAGRGMAAPGAQVYAVPARAGPARRHRLHSRPAPADPAPVAHQDCVMPDHVCKLAALLLAAAVALAHAADAPAPVFVMHLDGAIGPASADQVHRTLERAAQAHAQLVVLQMDTPGGLDTAMRSIVKDILAAPMPIAGFVSPQGARAASAGTYILYASHIAAMAPATNVGAATPVAIGLPSPGGGAEPPARPASAAASGAAAEAGHDTLAAKRINDAAAYLRGLAQLRGRDTAWAEQAVRESVSLSAPDALARKVIDLVAADVPDLLRQLDGRVVALGGAGAASVTLATAKAPVVAVEPDWRGRLLAVISDPSLALVLMMIGIYGLLFEFMNPGSVAPGVIGGLCLLLALWGLQMLPINYAGLGLILLGIAFFVAEAFVPSYGVLGIGGVAAFAFGALLLIDSEVPGLRVPLVLIVGLALASAAAVIGIAGMAARARRRPLASGATRMLGMAGEVLEFAGGEGWALVAGERWRMRAVVALLPGQRVCVAGIDGLTLEVTPLADANNTANTPQGALS